MRHIRGSEEHENNNETQKDLPIGLMVNEKSQ